MWKVIVFFGLFFTTIFCADLKKIKLESSNTQQLWDLIWQDEVDAKHAEELLNRGADPNNRQFEFGAIDEGWDMLSASILQAHFHLIKPLLKHGADVHKALFPPISFIMALVHGYVGSCGAKASHEHEGYCFFVRARNNYPDINNFKTHCLNALQNLINYRADVNAPINDVIPKTAFAMAYDRGNADACLILQKGGAKS